MAGLIGIVRDSLFLVPCTGSPLMRIVPARRSTSSRFTFATSLIRHPL